MLFWTGLILLCFVPRICAQTIEPELAVAPAQCSVTGGFFEAPSSLSLTSATPGAAIYYSFNSGEPGPGKGHLYTGPILLTNSTVVRARAYRDGFKPSAIETHTYLFLADVIHQASDGQAPDYFPPSWGPNAVDYGMDPNIVSRHTPAEWREALTQIPSISIVTEMENLFDPVTGIYANALEHGEILERPASIELLDPANVPQSRFQENCGLRIRGGFSRNPQYAKRSFRIFFRREYGSPKLNYRLFDRDGADEFDTFDLRTSQNYAWAIDGRTGQHDTMVREVFCRETLGVLGQPTTRSRYYHLYLNGQYWGLYETQERPEAAYGSTYFGGQKEDFDVVKGANHVGGFVTEATDGDLEAFRKLWTMARSAAADPANSNYFALLGRNADGTRHPALPVLLDVDNLIDYMLVIFYTGDGDATLSSFLNNERPNNWFGLRNRNDPNRGFIFFNHDAEHTLGAPYSQVDRTGPFLSVNQNNFTYANPQWIHQDLTANAEYRLRFADHVQRHFFDSGALTPEAGTNRFLRKAAQIDKAIRAYSARWGDAQREPPYGEKEWRERISHIVQDWFPTRTAMVLQQLRRHGLFPALSAPQIRIETNPALQGWIVPSPGRNALQGAPEALNSGAGLPAAGSIILSHVNSKGAIYFTTDGDDPRRVGGAVAPSAQVYAMPVPVPTGTRVLARVLDGTNWSALAEARFFLAQNSGGLRVTEIMYNPPMFSDVDGENFEFLELKNTGANLLDLSGFSFTAGVDFTFPNGTRLAPGNFFLLVRDATHFTVKYPGVAFHGVFTGKLDNGGETLTLQDPSGASVFSFRYDDDPPWPADADGAGYSLVPVLREASSDPTHPANWRVSARLGGSPGSDDPEGAPDTDADGMPDVWELAHGFNPSSPADAKIDTDSDGHTNQEEYVAGTDPRDPASVLRMQTSKSGSALILSFGASSNVAYRLHSSMQFPVDSWQVLTNLPPALTNRLVTLSASPAAVGQFYRLQALRP